MRKITREEALAYHSRGRRGKVEVVPSKPCRTQEDLSLAYSPGVAEPCLEFGDLSVAFEGVQFEACHAAVEVRVTHGDRDGLGGGAYDLGVDRGDRGRGGGFLAGARNRCHSTDDQ